MIIHQYRSGADTCDYHRILMPSRYCGDLLKKEGIEVSCNNYISSKGDEFDIFTWHGVPPSLERLIGYGTMWQSKGKKIVWSLDDDYMRVPSWNPVNLSDMQITTAMWAARNANHVLVSTETLAETMSERVTILAPNLLEIPLYKPFERDRSKIRIMFAGSNTHVEDLTQTIDGIYEVLKKYPRVEVILFGCSHPELIRRHLYDGVIEHPVSPLKDYWNIVATYAPDIWICPLVDCEFNRAKSNLKVIEGMALEAAVIASDVEPYRNTITSGVDGVLVNPENPSSWVEALCWLIEDEDARKRFTQAGRQLVEDRYNWHSEKCREPWVNYYRKIASKAK